MIELVFDALLISLTTMPHEDQNQAGRNDLQAGEMMRDAFLIYVVTVLSGKEVKKAYLMSRQEK